MNIDLFPETLPYPHPQSPEIHNVSMRLHESLANIMPTSPFIDLKMLDGENIVLDIAYASADNFAGKAFYGKNASVLLRREVARGLLHANAILREEHGTNYTLIVYDAGRPQSSHEAMYAWAMENGKTDYFADPKRGSIHSFGCAVDVSILYKGKPIDMGTGFDELSDFSGRKREGELTEIQRNNRTLLRNLMKKGGFEPINDEWWHFDFGGPEYRSIIRENLSRIA